MTPFTIELIGWVILLSGATLSLTGLPGTLVGVLGILLWLFTGSPAEIHIYEHIIFIVVLFIAEGLEQLGGIIGLSLSGIHRSGWWGAIIGAFTGLIGSIIFLNPLGIPIGIGVGAFAGEYLEREDIIASLKAAGAFLVGKFSGYVFKNILMWSTVIYAAVTRFIL